MSVTKRQNNSAEESTDVKTVPIYTRTSDVKKLKVMDMSGHHNQVPKFYNTAQGLMVATNFYHKDGSVYELLTPVAFPASQVPCESNNPAQLQIAYDIKEPSLPCESVSIIEADEDECGMDVAAGETFDDTDPLITLPESQVQDFEEEIPKRSTLSRMYTKKLKSCESVKEVVLIENDKIVTRLEYIPDGSPVVDKGRDPSNNNTLLLKSKAAGTDGFGRSREPNLILQAVQKRHPTTLGPGKAKNAGEITPPDMKELTPLLTKLTITPADKSQFREAKDRAIELVAEHIVFVIFIKNRKDYRILGQILMRSHPNILFMSNRMDMVGSEAKSTAKGSKKGSTSKALAVYQGTGSSSVVINDGPGPSRSVQSDASAKALNTSATFHPMDPFMSQVKAKVKNLRLAVARAKKRTCPSIPVNCLPTAIFENRNCNRKTMSTYFDPVKSVEGRKALDGFVTGDPLTSELDEALKNTFEIRTEQIRYGDKPYRVVEDFPCLTMKHFIVKEAAFMLSVPDMNAFFDNYHKFLVAVKRFHRHDDVFRGFQAFVAQTSTGVKSPFANFHSTAATFADTLLSKAAFPTIHILVNQNGEGSNAVILLDRIQIGFSDDWEATVSLFPLLCLVLGIDIVRTNTGPKIFYGLCFGETLNLKIKDEAYLNELKNCMM